VRVAAIRGSWNVVRNIVVVVVGMRGACGGQVGQGLCR
jgi:hypothetical protein